MKDEDRNRKRKFDGSSGTAEINTLTYYLSWKISKAIVKAIVFNFSCNKFHTLMHFLNSMKRNLGMKEFLEQSFRFSVFLCFLSKNELKNKIYVSRHADSGHWPARQFRWWKINEK